MAAEPFNRTGRDGDGTLVFDGVPQRVTVEAVNPVTQRRGFIFAVHPTGKEVFLHRSASFLDVAVFDALVTGSVVECKIRETHKGWRAVDAQLVG